MPICVTGASGFVGSHLVSDLLRAGYHVRATVRDPADPAKTAHLRALADGAPGTLELRAGDLLRPGSFDAALDGCEGLFHVAAVARLTARDPQRDIVDPAVEGVRNVLGAAARAGTVRRVVLTSSVAAMGGYPKAAARSLTEADWNDEATLRDPYEYAKTKEERLAWELSKDAPWSLVTINPAMILGPLLDRSHQRASPTIVRDVLVGTFPALPRFNFGIVDVRDVALAHRLAYERTAVEGRLLLCAGNRWFVDIARTLAAAFPERAIRVRSLPDVFLYIAALFDKRMSIRTVREMAGVEPRYDGTRAPAALGFSYRDIDVSVVDTARSFAPYL